MWAAGTFYILLLRNSPFAQTVILQDIVSFLGISSSSPVPERARAIQIASRVSDSSRRLSLPLPWVARLSPISHLYLVPLLVKHQRPSSSLSRAQRRRHCRRRARKCSAAAAVAPGDDEELLPKGDGYLLRLEDLCMFTSSENLQDK